MVVAPVDQRDLDRRAGQPKRRFQPAEAGADNHHAMGFCRPRLLCRHLASALGFGFLRALTDLGVYPLRSKSDLPTDRQRKPILKDFLISRRPWREVGSLA